MSVNSMIDAAVDGVVNVGFDLAMRRHRRRNWPAFERAMSDPLGAQERTLRAILTRNAATTFGSDHRFDRIGTVDSYRESVPVQDYESLRPLIEDQERTGTPNLTADQPVIYAQTSGTSGAPKFIPLTADGVERVGRAQRLFASALHRGTSMFAGRIVGIGSPAIEGHLPGGTPYGSASGMVYEQMPSVVRRKYVLGPEVLAIVDHDARYEVIAALCMASPDVTGVATANPSTLLRLRSVIVDHWDELLTAVATGEPPAADRLDRHQREAVGRALAGDPKRARALARIGDRRGPDVGYRDLWPRLGAITTWTGGSAGFALSALAPHLDPSTKVVELGYSASELRGTIGIDPATNLCAPLVDDNVYEFVARQDRESAVDGGEAGPFLGLHELEEGGQYYLYATTFDGLYRYDMNDIVEVTGRFGRTPTLAFVQKGRGVTNITGEKLSESQVITAVDDTQRANDMVLTFFVVLADEMSSKYRLYFEPGLGTGSAAGQTSVHTDGLATRLAVEVDKRLGELNIEYRSKRASGRLGPMVAVEVAAGTADAYRAACVTEGQRDAQFKFLFLQNRTDCAFDFDAHRVSTATP